MILVVGLAAVLLGVNYHKLADALGAQTSPWLGLWLAMHYGMAIDGWTGPLPPLLVIDVVSASMLHGLLRASLRRMGSRES